MGNYPYSYVVSRDTVVKGSVIDAGGRVKFSGPLDGGRPPGGGGPLDGGHTSSAFNKHLFLPLQPSPERVASDLLRSHGESGVLFV